MAATTSSGTYSLASSAIECAAATFISSLIVFALTSSAPLKIYGKEYIIPSTFDPRLISVIPVAVAKAAIKSGVARKKIENFET